MRLWLQNFLLKNTFYGLSKLNKHSIFHQKYNLQLVANEKSFSARFIDIYDFFPSALPGTKMEIR